MDLAVIQLKDSHLFFIFPKEIAKMVAQITMLAKDAEALAKYSLDMLAAIGGFVRHTR